MEEGEELIVRGVAVGWVFRAGHGTCVFGGGIPCLLCKHSAILLAFASE